MAATENPELIRREVERTREEIAATADALAYKADPPARVRHAVGGLRDRISGAAEQAPDGQDLRRQGGRMKRAAEDNPMGLLAGSVALGVLAGTVIPATRAEKRAVAPIVEQVGNAASGAATEVREAATEPGGGSAGHSVAQPQFEATAASGTTLGSQMPPGA